jgi:4-hydroxybutyrate dehydrogenase
MELLKMKTKVHRFDDFAGFAEQFQIGENDLILTNGFLYEPFIKPLNLKARAIMQEAYGTGEPTDLMMNAILTEALKAPFDRIIAVGGGTVLDIAKLLVLDGVTDVVTAFERSVPLKKGPQLIAVPTTCGTGSEVTNVTIAELTTKQTKMGLADDILLPDDAVLIPSLMKGLPYSFYLYSSVDALIHAVESYVSPKANVYTKMFSIQAIEMILEVYSELIEKGENHRFEKFEEMAIASNFAGVAFGTAGVGAVHAMSYPIGGKYHVPHGEANYQFFTEVFRHYMKLKPQGEIEVLCDILAKSLKCEKAVAFDVLETFLSKLLPKKPLKSYGMTSEEIDLFTDRVLTGQQRLLANNYVAFTAEDIRGIYSRLF